MNNIIIKNQYSVLLILGALMTLAIPPVNFFPIAFIAFPILFWLVADASSGFKAFLLGLVFGAGYFIIGLYWFTVAFIDLYEKMLWLFPFASLLIPTYIAGYYGVASWLAYYFRKNKILYVFIYATLLFWAEYLRGYITNFPWNFIGSIWYDVLPVLQIISIIGIYGLTFLTILWAVTPYLLISKTNKKPNTMLAYGLIGLFIAINIWGALRIQQNNTSYRDDILLQIMQPNVTTKEKNTKTLEAEKALFKRHLDMMDSRPNNLPSVFVSIWPEAAFNVTQYDVNKYVKEIASHLPDNGYAVIGVHRTVNSNNETKIFNTMITTDKSGDLLAQHDKFKPVPWGEYVPLKNILKYTPLYKYVQKLMNITAGEGPETLKLGGGLTFSPIICFESAFSGGVKKQGDYPDFLLHTANDAWSAGSVGPYQHYGFSRMRAIEEGLPLLRSGTIGISAVFDSYGRELQRLNLHEKGVIYTKLPQRSKQTFFSKYGNIPLLYIMGILTILLFMLSLLINRKDR